MIVDCHTHLWTNADQLGADAEMYLYRQQGDAAVAAGPAEHAAATACVDKVLVLGFRSVLLDAAVPNDLIAAYVDQAKDKAIGVAAVDPNEDGAEKIAAAALEREQFRALTVSPTAQDFHPADSRAMALYELAGSKGAPVLFTQSTHFVRKGRMEHARPFLLDEIAREFPDLVMVISSLGDPWVEEGVALLGKHPNVYGDLSGLIRRPWQAYSALVLAHQYNVMDKVLFGSDFPLFAPVKAIETVYRLHEFTKGTNLPTVPRESLRSVIERDALAALGIARPGEMAPASAPQAEEPDDEL